MSEFSIRMTVISAQLSPRLAMYAIALRRRLALWLAGDFDPYPPAPAGARLSPFLRDRAEAASAPLALSWAKAGGDVADWQARLRAKLVELSGWRRLDRPPAVRARARRDGAGHGLRHRRAYLDAWPDAAIPVDILWRPDQAWPAPVMLCLQGTNSGAHLSWGEARMPPDPVKIAAGLDFARQAAARGLVAVCIEQRGFGERRERALSPRSADPCIDAVLHGLLVGRTLVGDRASDVSAVIDWLATGGAELDLDLRRLYALGHSAGGTVAVHAAAIDERIAGVIASGCLGPIRDTLAARRDSGGQNTIPGQLNWFELADVVACCAPRPVLAASGVADHIFPFAGVQAVVDAALPVYDALQAAGRLRALALAGGHRFDPDRIWPAFDELLG